MYLKAAHMPPLGQFSSWQCRHQANPFQSCRSSRNITRSVVCLQTKGEVLGRLRGVSVKMLMHHSRNSEQKQWDETLVLALSGMGRLLRAHLPLLVPMQAFPQVLTITAAAAAAAGFRV